MQLDLFYKGREWLLSSNRFWVFSRGRSVAVTYTAAWILSQRILINLNGTWLPYSEVWMIFLIVSQIQHRRKGMARRTEQ